jgi:cytochrome P450/NADPH-cytochrome P450 reductase
VFSREPDKPKTYVQQAIQANSDDVWRLLRQDAIVFVCGEASRMAPDVRQAFVGLFREHTSAVEDGQAWLAGLVGNRRYLEDIWVSGPVAAEKERGDVDKKSTGDVDVAPEPRS